MDIYKIRSDGERELLCSGLNSAEVQEFLEWFSYTKPLGPSVKIVVRESSALVCAFTSAGVSKESTTHLGHSLAA